MCRRDRRGDPTKLTVRMDFDNANQVFRMRYGQMPQRQSVDHTENKGIRTYANSEQQGCCDGKHRTLCEEPDAEA
jgi:hypothetical protein